MVELNDIERRINSDLFFIHGNFGSFFRGVLNWFGDKFYPRFEYKVIGSYDKAVEFFKKKQEFGHEINEPYLPCLSLDPMLDFSNEERGGRFLWQHSQLAPNMSVRLWKNINLKEQDVIVTPVFSRYQGTFEIMFWLNSVYELMDFRLALFQFCGGFNRWLRPEHFWSTLVLPEKIVTFENEEGIPLDWGNTTADIVHLSTINQQKMGVPIALDAMWKLDSCNDSSQKYGGDSLAEYKLQASFTYEVNMPTFVVLSNKVDPTLRIGFSLGNTYSKYPAVSPYKMLAQLKDHPVYQEHEVDISEYWRVPIEAECDTDVIVASVESTRFPERYQTWKAIVSGNFYYLSPTDLPELREVEKTDILMIDSYTIDLLPYIRKCGAVISPNYRESSDLYQKCEILNKPFLGGFDSAELALVNGFLDNEVTLDPIKRKLYLGIIEAEELRITDPEYGKDVLDQIKEEDPDAYREVLHSMTSLEDSIPDHRAWEDTDKLFERLITDHADGTQKLFQLDFVIHPDSVKSVRIYADEVKQIHGTDYDIVENSAIRFVEAPPEGTVIYIGGELLVIKTTTLVGVYEFTDADLCADSIEVALPKPLYHEGDLILNSYGGRMTIGNDYNIDLENQTVTITYPAKEEEIIEFFYYEL